MWTLDLPRLAQTCPKLYTLFRTDLCKIIHPVKEHKNHNLSSGTSPYRSYKGVPPPGQDSRLEEEEKKPQHKRISRVSFARGAVLFCSA